MIKVTKKYADGEVVEVAADNGPLAAALLREFEEHYLRRKQDEPMEVHDRRAIGDPSTTADRIAGHGMSARPAIGDPSTTADRIAGHGATAGWHEPAMAERQEKALGAAAARQESTARPASR